MRALEAVGRFVLDLLFPLRCLGCGEEGEIICEMCRRRLLRISPPFCPKCGKPLLREGICGECYRERAFDGMRSALFFAGLIREAVHQFKYQGIKALADPLGDMLTECFLRYAIPADVVVPVPLHPKKLRERGYNQAGLLGRRMARNLGLPFDDRTLIKARETPPQVGLSREERLRNVKGAFACRDGALAGRRVVLVDDVITTGATAESCAEALRRGGASSVWIFSLAREI